jgi:cytochrome c oxidase assembly protein subunit 15
MSALANPWPRRTALWTALAAIPLLLFGGAVTTLRAGMAIEGWWVLEPGNGDHFLLFYPLEKWFRDAGTFVEHTHRLFGTAVGLLAITHLALTFALRRERRLRLMAVAMLLAVCAQGALGGFRVLESSPELAFVHGAFAQAVFALLAVGAVMNARSYADARPSKSTHAVGLQRTALITCGIVYAQIVLGAWLRHSGSSLAMAFHVLLVVGVLGAIGALSNGLRRAAEDAGEKEAPVLLRAARRLRLIVGAQIALGVLATFSVYVFSGGFQGVVSTGELIFATLHVAFGALLLVQCVSAAVWVRRTLSVARAPRVDAPGRASGGVLGEAAWGEAR